MSRGPLPLLAGSSPDPGASLVERLDLRTRAGSLVTPEAEGAVRCVACGHRCLIRPGRRGICKVRFNREGELRLLNYRLERIECVAGKRLFGGDNPRGTGNKTKNEEQGRPTEA